MLTSVFSSIGWEQWFLYLSQWFWGFHKQMLKQSKHLVNISSLTASSKICFFLFIVKYLSHYNSKVWFWYLLFKWSVTNSVVSHSLQPHALCNPTRLLHPWDSPGKNTGVGFHFLLQEIFPIQELNLGLIHCKQILYWVTRGALQMGLP